VTGGSASGTPVNYGGALSGAGSLVGGLAQGGTVGDLNAATGAAKLGGALTGNQSIGLIGGIGGNALGVYSGLERGGPLGYTGAALSGISGANGVDKLLNGSGFLSGTEGAALGGAGDILGIVNGVKQGGLSGYGSAALNAYQLYNAAAPLAYGLSNGATLADIAADADAGAAGAAGAGSALAAAGPIGLALAGGLIWEQGITAKGNDPNDAITNVGQGQSLTTTPGGYQGLRTGNLIVASGAGGSGPGAAQAYLAGANGKQIPLGSTGTQIVQYAASQLGDNPANMSSITYNPNAGATDMTTLQGSLVGTGGSFAQPSGWGGTNMSAQQVSNSLSGLYNSTGGQSAWGTSFSGWLQQLAGSAAGFSM
jgi:hypothetical protein